MMIVSATLTTSTLNDGATVVTVDGRRYVDSFVGHVRFRSCYVIGDSITLEQSAHWVRFGNVFMARLPAYACAALLVLAVMFASTGLPIAATVLVATAAVGGWASNRERITRIPADGPEREVIVDAARAAEASGDHVAAVSLAQALSTGSVRAVVASASGILKVCRADELTKTSPAAASADTAEATRALERAEVVLREKSRVDDAELAAGVARHLSVLGPQDQQHALQASVVITEIIPLLDRAPDPDATADGNAAIDASLTVLRRCAGIIDDDVRSRLQAKRRYTAQWPGGRNELDLP